MKDLAFLPLGVGDGEWGRLEEVEELDINKEKIEKEQIEKERGRKRKKREKGKETNQSLNVFRFS